MLVRAEITRFCSKWRLRAYVCVMKCARVCKSQRAYTRARAYAYMRQMSAVYNLTMVKAAAKAVA